MKNSEKHQKLIKEIVKKYGIIINLQETPGVLIEILRNYGKIFTNGGGGGGGMGPGTSTIAVGISPSEELDIKNTVLLKEILKIQKELRTINKKLKD